MSDIIGVTEDSRTAQELGHDLALLDVKRSLWLARASFSLAGLAFAVWAMTTSVWATLLAGPCTALTFVCLWEWRSARLQFRRTFVVAKERLTLPAAARLSPIRYLQERGIHVDAREVRDPLFQAMARLPVAVLIGLGLILAFLRIIIALHPS